MENSKATKPSDSHLTATHKHAMLSALVASGITMDRAHEIISRTQKIVEFMNTTKNQASSSKDGLPLSEMEIVAFESNPHRCVWFVQSKEKGRGICGKPVNKTIANVQDASPAWSRMLNYRALCQDHAKSEFHRMVEGPAPGEPMPVISSFSMLTSSAAGEKFGFDPQDCKHAMLEPFQIKYTDSIKRDLDMNLLDFIKEKCEDDKIKRHAAPKKEVVDRITCAHTVEKNGKKVRCKHIVKKEGDLCNSHDGKTPKVKGTKKETRAPAKKGVPAHSATPGEDQKAPKPVNPVQAVPSVENMHLHSDDDAFSDEEA